MLPQGMSFTSYMYVCDQLQNHSGSSLGYLAQGSEGIVLELRISQLYSWPGNGNSSSPLVWESIAVRKIETEDSQCRTAIQLSSNSRPLSCQGSLRLVSAEVKDLGSRTYLDNRCHRACDTTYT